MSSKCTAAKAYDILGIYDFLSTMNRARVELSALTRTKAAHRFPKTRSVLPKNRVSVPCSSPPANLRAR